jgi:hypothetical protein
MPTLPHSRSERQIDWAANVKSNNGRQAAGIQWTKLRHDRGEEKLMEVADVHNRLPNLREINYQLLDGLLLGLQT